MKRVIARKQNPPLGSMRTRIRFFLLPGRVSGYTIETTWYWLCFVRIREQFVHKHDYLWDGYSRDWWDPIGSETVSWRVACDILRMSLTKGGSQ